WILQDSKASCKCPCGILEGPCGHQLEDPQHKKLQQKLQPDLAPGDPHPYTCMECRKCFSYSSTLMENQCNITREWPYKNSNLIMHYRIHTGEQSSNLTKHHKIHTRKKSYKCLKCRKDVMSIPLIQHQVRWSTLRKGITSVWNVGRASARALSEGTPEDPQLGEAL
uniref:C2H2-type domain-containing protein n=1 Tax=Malurus cyaneus samueli TaxID=2593467 RepID=A0A8C5U8R9_9PASS